MPHRPNKEQILRVLEQARIPNPHKVVERLTDVHIQQLLGSDITVDAIFSLLTTPSFTELPQTVKYKEVGLREFLVGLGLENEVKELFRNNEILDELSDEIPHPYYFAIQPRLMLAYTLKQADFTKRLDGVVQKRARRLNPGARIEKLRGTLYSNSWINWAVPEKNYGLPTEENGRPVALGILLEREAIAHFSKRNQEMTDDTFVKLCHAITTAIANSPIKSLDIIQLLTNQKILDRRLFSGPKITVLPHFFVDSNLFEVLPTELSQGSDLTKWWAASAPYYALFVNFTEKLGTVLASAGHPNFLIAQQLIELIDGYYHTSFDEPNGFSTRLINDMYLNIGCQRQEFFIPMIRNIYDMANNAQSPWAEEMTSTIVRPIIEQDRFRLMADESAWESHFTADYVLNITDEEFWQLFHKHWAQAVKASPIMLTFRSSAEVFFNYFGLNPEEVSELNITTVFKTNNTVHTTLFLSTTEGGSIGQFCLHFDQGQIRTEFSFLKSDATPESPILIGLMRVLIATLLEDFGSRGPISTASTVKERLEASLPKGTSQKRKQKAIKVVKPDESETVNKEVAVRAMPKLILPKQETEKALVWKGVRDQSMVAAIMKKIDLYNKAVVEGLSQFADSKELEVVRHNGFPIWQIRHGDYRVLATRRPNGIAMVYWIGHKDDVDKHLK